MKRLNVMKRKTSTFGTQRKEPQTPSAPKPDPNANFKTFSQFIQSSTELNNLIKAQISEELSEDVTNRSSFALIGLHSCGNLSNSIMNLYLSNNNNNDDNGKFRKLLCNVGCCYNLLNEKYANDFESFKDIKKTNVQIDDSSKFPISGYLNKSKYALSFNIRMLGCHSLNRCLQELDEFKEVFILIFLSGFF